MSKSFELVVLPGGAVEAIYSDDRAEMMAEIGEVTAVCRLSNVEWEDPGDEDGPGWTVRSAADPRLALRWATPDRVGGGLVASAEESLPIARWERREMALSYEVEHAWELQPSPGAPVVPGLKGVA